MSAEAKDCGCGPRDMCTTCASSEELADGIMRFLSAEIRGAELSSNEKEDR